MCTTNTSTIICTPKKYHASKLAFIKREYGITLKETKEYYDTPEAIAEHNQEWINMVREAFKNGQSISKRVLDNLERLRKGSVLSFLHDYPNSVIPNGYVLPDYR